MNFVSVVTDRSPFQGFVPGWLRTHGFTMGWYRYGLRPQSVEKVRSFGVNGFDSQLMRTAGVASNAQANTMTVSNL